MNKQAYIRKTPNKEEWCVYSEEGKNLGCYPSKSQAKERLQQIHFFKSQHHGSNLVKDLRRLASYIIYL